MAQGYAKELVGAIDGTLAPAAKIDGRVQNAKERAFIATLDLSQASVAKNNGDTNVLFRIPAGYKPIRFQITSTVTLGATATVAVGVAGTPAKYRAAAIFTTPDVPTQFITGAAAAQDPLATPEDVILTVGAAALPGAGLVTIIAECAGR